MLTLTSVRRRSLATNAATVNNELSTARGREVDTTSWYWQSLRSTCSRACRRWLRTEVLPRASQIRVTKFLASGQVGANHSLARGVCVSKCSIITQRAVENHLTQIFTLARRTQPDTGRGVDQQPRQHSRYLGANYVTARKRSCASAGPCVII
jgi:hypothetical protein